MHAGYAGGARLKGTFIPEKVSVHIALNDKDIAFLDKASQELELDIQPKIFRQWQHTALPQDQLAESIVSGYRRKLAASLLCAKLVQWIRVSASQQPVTPATKEYPAVLTPAALNPAIRQRVAAWTYATHSGMMQKELTLGMFRYPTSPTHPTYGIHAKRIKQCGRYSYSIHCRKHRAFELLMHGLKNWKNTKPQTTSSNVLLISSASSSKTRSRPAFASISSKNLRFWGHQLAADIRSCAHTTT